MDGSFGGRGAVNRYARITRGSYVIRDRRISRPADQPEYTPVRPVFFEPTDYSQYAEPAETLQPSRRSYRNHYTIAAAAVGLVGIPALAMMIVGGPEKASIATRPIVATQEVGYGSNNTSSQQATKPIAANVGQAVAAATKPVTAPASTTTTSPAVQRPVTKPVRVNPQVVAPTPAVNPTPLPVAPAAIPEPPFVEPVVVVPPTPASDQDSEDSEEPPTPAPTEPEPEILPGG